MLNNRGWGLQLMMVFILILMLALVIISVLSNKLNKAFNEEYVKYEEEIVVSAKNYFELNKDLELVTIKKLIDDKYLNNKKELNCTGYVIKSISYKAYIKCDNYTTVGYSRGYDY